MKRIVTILLLVVMAVQAAGSYYTLALQDHGKQDVYESIDSGSKEEKKENYALVSQLPLIQLLQPDEVQLSLSKVIILSSNVLEHLAPPPDSRFQIFS